MICCMGIRPLITVDEKGGLNFKAKHFHFVLLHHQSMSIDMLNLNQYYKQLLPVLTTVFLLCLLLIWNIGKKKIAYTDI